MWKDSKHRAPIEIGPRAAHNSGLRAPLQIRLVVMHDTEGGTARSVAAYFHSSAARASTHWVVDEDRAVRCLADDVVPWGAPGANRDGIHIEQCGWAKWSRVEWLRHQSTLKRAAWRAARACVDHRIEPRWLTDQQLAGGAAAGLTTHAQCSRVFAVSGGHTDPGPNYPASYFLRLVERRVGWLKAEEAT